MNKSGGKGAKGLSGKAGQLTLTGIQDLPQKAIPAKAWRRRFRFRYTTGPFLLPQGAGSLDWTILNNAGCSPSGEPYQPTRSMPANPMAR